MSKYSDLDFTMVSRNNKIKRRRVRPHIKFYLIGFVAVLAVFLLVSGVQGTFYMVSKITESIMQLDSRQSELESSIEGLAAELEEQKAINEKIATLLENQTIINSYEEGVPSYYGMSDRSTTERTISRSSGLIPRRNDVIRDVQQSLPLSNRLETISAAQSKTLEEQEAAKNDFSTFYAKVTGNTDLCGYVNVDEAAFNKYIASKAPKNSPFRGRADVFLKASEITGLDPRYIFAHASVESSYGKSNFAVNRGNYFGIGAFDRNPNNAYNMGDGLEEGIINGAKWIKEKYYDKGRTTLNKMKAAGYATDPAWVGNIVSVMNV